MDYKEYLSLLPGPVLVPRRVMNAMLKPIINHRGREFRELYAKLQEGLKYLFKTKNFVTILSASGTAAVEFAVANTISDGDRILLIDTGFFSGVRASRTIEAYGGIPIHLKAPLGSAPTYDDVKKALDEYRALKAILIVYSETSTGVLVKDLRDICIEAHRRGLITIVDAVSAAGGVDLMVDDWCIDLCVSASQKCLAAPPGLSFISVSDRIMEEAYRCKPRSLYLSLREYIDYGLNNEVPFTPSIPLIYALSEALDMLIEEGLENRIARHRVLSKAFYNGLETLGFKPLPKLEYRSPTLVAVEPPEDASVDRIVSMLRDIYGILVARGMGELKNRIIRIGCMGVISSMETLYTLQSIESIMVKLGYRVELGSSVAEASKVLSSS
ncbi:MAG: alanine--glyoxylate aminotransferase family protein [Candidatus Bathyarchaeota archaeon]|nr:alanine--glyoxylate aminotransferase family protein [Candidatus Bathyarchaeota archaeon]